MVNLCFGLSPPLVGLFQSCLILKFHRNTMSLSSAVIYEEMHLEEKERVTFNDFHVFGGTVILSLARFVSHTETVNL